MNKSLIGAIVVVIVVLAASGIYFTSNRSNPDSNSSSTTSTTGNDSRPNGSTNKKLTRDEVKEHDREDDCWTIIDGKVYDITKYVPRHPGGDEILEACGEDGSSLFNNRTTEDGKPVGTGTPHSGSARGQLEQYLVGELQS